MEPVVRDPCPDVMTARMADRLLPLIAAEMPHIVLVQGDTTSAYAGALAADQLGVPVGHVEAGLRSHDLASPWPEERNRVEIDRIADLLFAPTTEAAGNLLDDRHVRGRISLTGNSGIDALLLMRRRLVSLPPAVEDGRALILLTCHRRESMGAGIDRICTAVLRLVARGDVRLLCPVHPNPVVGDMVRDRLGNHAAISLVEPLSYRDTVAAMAASRLILTDSGGIQEEAPALGVPALVLRDVTERPEGIVSGNLALVGTDPDRIVAAASRLLDDPAVHARMARPSFPFGRGDASEKILDVIEQYFSSGPLDDHPLPSERRWIMDGAL
jgi:UDP-N-acetylglucosamine 2-epimerase (non-hydrolysing)